MNLTWHIVRKDLVRLRLPLLVWSILLASQVFVSVQLLGMRSADFRWFAEMGMLLNQLEAIGLVLSFILAAALVLDDPLVGTDMSWVTRPISGGRLLRAKLMGAALTLGLIPLLIWMPWWLYCTFSAGEMAITAAKVIGVQAIAVVPAFVLASVVGQTGRFVLFSVLAVVAVVVAIINFMAWGGHHPLSPGLWQGRLLLAAGLLTCCGGVVVWRQYLTRRLASSAVTLTVGVVLAGVIVGCWPWNPLNLLPESREQVAGSEAITGEIVGLRIAALGNAPGPEDIGVSIDLLFKGVPADVSLSTGVADVELRWPDGAVLRRNRVKMARGLRADYGEDSAVQRALGLPSGHGWLYHWDPETNAKQAEMAEAARLRLGKSIRPPPHHESAQISLTLAVTPEMATKIEADCPACTISARIMLGKPALLFEMPVTADTWAAGQGARLHVLQVSPAQWRDRENQPLNAYIAEVAGASAPGLAGLSLYAVDRKHGIAAFQGRTFSIAVVPVTANIEGLYFDLREPRLWRNGRWVESPGWLENTMLAAVTYRDAGGFNREFRADRLTIEKDNGE